MFCENKKYSIMSEQLAAIVPGPGPGPWGHLQCKLSYQPTLSPITDTVTVTRVWWGWTSENKMDKKTLI